MKKIINLGLVLVTSVMLLCSCGTNVMDVAIVGGAESATEAIQKYYEAMSDMDFDTLMNVSASLNKSCVQNTVAKYDEEKFNAGIEKMKTEMKKDVANVTIIAVVVEEKIYDNSSDEYKAFTTKYKELCAGIEKIQSYAQVKTTLTYKEEKFEFNEEKVLNCIKIKDKWFVFDYSENVETEEDKEGKKKIAITGGGSSIEDVSKKYFAAISEKNAINLADVLVNMNATASQAIGTDYDEAKHNTALEAMKAEMAADTDNATLTPTVSNFKEYEVGSEQFNTFVSTHADVLKDTTRIGSYADVSISLRISVPGEYETFTATENITCIKIDSSWFVIPIGEE